MKYYQKYNQGITTKGITPKVHSICKLDIYADLQTAQLAFVINIFDEGNCKSSSLYWNYKLTRKIE